VAESKREVKTDSVSTEGLEDVFDLSGTDGTPAGTEGHDEPESSRMSGTMIDYVSGHPGQDTIDATDIATFISTADAAKFAGVDSRTIRRWHEQKKVRSQFSKGKLLIAQEDLRLADQEPNLFNAGASGTDSETQAETSRMAPGAQTGNEDSEPGRPGQSTDIPQTPVIVFSDFLDRIERLSRENGELSAMLEEQRRENRTLKLLTDNQHKAGWLFRFCSWFKA